LFHYNINGSDAYLGQALPSDTAKVFAPGLLEDSDIVLGRVGFYKDGKQFYYGYAKHRFGSKGPAQGKRNFLPTEGSWQNWLFRLFE
jgi:hypothetical protein